MEKIYVSDSLTASIHLLVECDRSARAVILKRKLSSAAASKARKLAC